MPETSNLIQVTEFSDKGAVVRVLTHKLHEHEASLLIQELRAYLDSSGRMLIAGDFEQVEYVASAGLGAMVTLNTELTRRGGKLVMINLSKDIMQALRLTKLDKLITIEKNLTAAQKRLLK